MHSAQLIQILSARNKEIKTKLKCGYKTKLKSDQLNILTFE